MRDIFIKSIFIEKVRHLSDVNIEIDNHVRKNLIITGANGSGKTSVLNAVANYFKMFTEGDINFNLSIIEKIVYYENELLKNLLPSDRIRCASNLNFFKEEYSRFYNGVIFNIGDINDVVESYSEGNFILGFYQAKRLYKVEWQKHIKDIEIKNTYTINERPSSEFIEYMKALKSKEAMYARKGEIEKANQIEQWFKIFENLLQKIYNDSTLLLDFDIDNLEFNIIQAGHEPFNFSQLSDGYAAILEIVVDLLMRTEKKGALNVQGVVLIDEIETHLHLEMQKQILPFLTTVFPKIQFIVTTHSPFVITSDRNAVVFDLERQVPVSGEQLYKYGYVGAVDAYYQVKETSLKLEEYFLRYKELVKIKDRTPMQETELVKLEQILDEVPDFLNKTFASEYTEIKFGKEFE